jgi:diadenosine tetraphosphate (Ap4A) HIT family hydrolase
MLENCIFCRLGVDGLGKHLLSKNGLKQIPCDRLIFESYISYAVLAPEQYTKGHSLVILKDHREDFTDPTITCGELIDFAFTINLVARQLKSELHAERIYIASLCDGVHHLHAHLIPRYKEDGTGFEWIGTKERDYPQSAIPQLTDDERVIYFESLSKQLFFH